jgi:hypothetical protein
MWEKLSGRVFGGRGVHGEICRAVFSLLKYITITENQYSKYIDDEIWRIWIDEKEKNL